MQHIEIGMAALTAACVVWARIHHHRADQSGGADIQGDK